jgi:hypothetical protein
MDDRVHRYWTRLSNSAYVERHLSWPDTIDGWYGKYRYTEHINVSGSRYIDICGQYCCDAIVEGLVFWG